MLTQKGAWLTAAALCAAAATVGVVRVGATAQEAARPAASPARPGEPDKAAIDRPFKSFTLRDLASDKKDAKVSLGAFKGKKAVVVMFMANRCGTTWTYEEKIGRMLKDYANKDVAFVAVHSNFRETDGEILGQIEQRNLAVPVLDDKPTQEFADYVGARATPTFLVIDKGGVLRYQGGFDRFGDETKSFVRPALDAVLSGKEVAVKTFRAFG